MAKLFYRRYYKGYCFLTTVSSLFLLLMISTIFLKKAIAYYEYPEPQAILTLGGDLSREKFTAQFAQNQPHLKIWISSGYPIEDVQPIFVAANIPDHRVIYDRRAIDTVTHFSTLMEDFKANNIHHIYLITSDFHIPRSTAIATFMLGSQGITFTPVPVPSDRPPESSFRILRDIGRSLVWIVTGRTGASLNPRYQERIEYIKSRESKKNTHPQLPLQ